MEKSPENAMRMRFLAKTFGSSKTWLLNTIRHPLVIALAQRKWNGRVYKLDHVVENTIILYERMRNDLEFLDRDKVILVPFDYSLQEEQGVRYYKNTVHKNGN